MSLMDRAKRCPISKPAAVPPIPYLQHTVSGGTGNTHTQLNHAVTATRTKLDGQLTEIRWPDSKCRYARVELHFGTASSLRHPARFYGMEIEGSRSTAFSFSPITCQHHGPQQPPTHDWSLAAEYTSNASTFLLQCLAITWCIWCVNHQDRLPVLPSSSTPEQVVSPTSVGTRGGGEASFHY